MMSNQTITQFKVQVTKTMNTVLKNAVFEVMTIFENALHDHQMEMAQKAEEVTQLKMKLQAAELRLKDFEPSSPGVETSQTQTDSKVFLEALRPTSDVAEIDVEVPDDWCAPLGCEVVTKEEDNVCPSVRLRQFSIPLHQIPINRNQEGIHCGTNPKYTSDGRRPQRISALNAKYKLIRNAKRSISRLGNQPIPMRNDMKRLLQDRRVAHFDLSGLDGIRTKEERKTLTRKEQDNPAEQKEEQCKSTAAQSKPDKVLKVGKTKIKYSCKFCKKGFDTEIDRKAHVILHKECRGCKKVFPFPSVLKNHKKGCLELNKLMLKEAFNPSKATSDEDGGPAPCQTQLIEKESTQPSSSVIESSTSIQYPDLEFSCRFCDCKFNLRSKLATHMQTHSNEQCFFCSICSVNFANHQALSVHMSRKHKENPNPIDGNEDVDWTKPLEDHENGEASPRKEDETKDGDDMHFWKTNLKDWHTMGTRCPAGFSCAFCQKILRNKGTLVEHFRIHTGEKPLSCKMCPTRFRYKTSLYAHMKKLHQLKKSTPT